MMFCRALYDTSAKRWENAVAGRNASELPCVKKAHSKR
jgi:hypothetical protein